MGWEGWPLERLMFILVGVLFIGIFIQVTLFHYRQNFRAAAMWIPVIATPLLALGTLGLSAFNVDWLRFSNMILLYIGVVAGLYGFIRHLVGVGQRVSGWTLQNFMVGPPIILPLTIVLTSALGLLALQWGALMQ